MGRKLTKESLKTEPKFELTLDEETHKKLINYLLLTNQATKRNQFINCLIEEKFEGKVFDNSYIKLEKPFYFNMKDLKLNRFVKATKKLPIHERKNIFIINYVPNNMDSFESDLKTYCSESIFSLHRGLLIVHGLEPNIKSLADYFFVFSYDSNEETIEIAFINESELDYYFKEEKEQQKIKEQFLSYNNKLHLDFAKNGATDMLYNDVLVSNRVIRKFTDQKQFKKLLIDNMDNGELNFDKKVAKQILENEFKNY